MTAKRQPWTADEVELLREQYPHQTAKALASTLGHPTSSIYHQAARLGLAKSTEFYESADARRIDGETGASTRFPKGNIPWNKGMTGLDIGGHETRFKPGSSPHNTRSVGEYRLTKDGTLQRKIGTAKGCNSKRWRGVHELVWIAANGPLPAGHICVFKPGMRTAELADITADKVECISLAENMRRNSYHRYGKDIARLVQLRGALNRKINRLTKESMT